MVEEQLGEVRFVVHDDSAGLDPEMAGLRQSPSLQVICPPFNLGHQRGIVFALRTIADQINKEDIIITLDSDGEDRPQDLKALLQEIEKARNPGHCVALVQRTKREESLLFKVFYFAYKNVFRWLTGTVIRSGNFACFYGEFVLNYINHPHFDLSYASTLVSLKTEKRMIKRPRGVRITGHSKMNFTSLITHGLRMLMPFIDQIAVRSLIAFASLFALSLVFGSGVLALKFFTSVAIPAWASFTLLLGLLSSLVALGNFLVLFAVFSQSQALAMQRLDKNKLGRSRKSDHLEAA